MRKITLLIFVLLGTLPSLSWAITSQAENIDVEIFKVSEEGKSDKIGTIHIQNNEEGVLFKPDISGLETGLHGFHLHENGSCEPAEKDGKTTAAAAAGGHFNPDSGNHNGPFEKGHKGDLPALYVDEEGAATLPVLAPNLAFEDLPDRALVIHAGGDNYSDSPEPLGGGGARVACGVITHE